MSNSKRIAKIEVVKSGSPPDVDSDFRTDIREIVKEHVSELYGKNNVSDIITFGTLAAKGAFKGMCTIYEVPFAAANKISALVPPPIEGVDCTIDDIFNPDSDRYSEGADFRAATSGAEWEKIIEGAKAISNRIKSTGVHACGVIMSREPLYETIPLQIRQKDGKVVTQWTYHDCESLGLIKFDFLGLDTVDIIQNSIEYIMKNGKTPPNMLEIIHGSMDDPQTYSLFQNGDTIGIFQFGSDLVRGFCTFMKPTEFEDLAATTALCRPGPMGMQSHVKYADRKNGRAPMGYIHPEFKGSPIDDVLRNTYNLIVYQEQVMRIASVISGFTLQEAEMLRKAMGKKKKEVMQAMEAKFLNGGMANGYSEEAMKVLWDTVNEFSKYGFNRSHSIAYAMTAYQSAYLKVHYPIEFMSSLISQAVGNKEKILMFLQEAKKMGIKVGSANINLSDVKVSPDYSGTSGSDIIYGLSAIDAVSEDVAQIIVKERNSNGAFKNIQDCVDRCSELGVTNKKIYENLALAGAFDCFGYSRQAVVESIPSIIRESKTKSNFGESLFDMFNEEESEDEAYLIDTEEYPFVVKLQKEANVIGFYLTDHPLSKVGVGLTQGGITPIKTLFKQQNSTTVNIIASVTDIKKKTAKRTGGKSIQLTLEDTTGSINANVQRNIVKGIDKKVAQDRIERLFTNGEYEVSADLFANAVEEEFEAYDDFEKNAVYVVNLTYRPSFGEKEYGARINDIRPLKLTAEGSLPIRVRFKGKETTNKELMEKKIISYLEKLAEKYPGDYPVELAVISDKDYRRPETDTPYFEKLLDIMEKEKEEKDKAELTKTVTKTQKSNSDIFGVNKEDKEKGESKTLRVLPTHDYSYGVDILSESEISDRVLYKNTGIFMDKNRAVEEILSNKFGADRVDFGIYNIALIEEGFYSG